MSLSYVLVKNLVGPQGSTGAAGRTIYNSSGPPAANTGVVGDFYLDTSAYVLYGPKTSASAWPTTGQSLVGPVGPSTPQTLPNDLKANSLVVAPVSGDTNAEQIQILDSSGNVKFVADASGNLTSVAAATHASLRVTQQTSQNSSSQTNAAVTFPGAFGSSTSYPLSGISSDSKGNLIFSYQGYPFMQTQNGGYSSAVGNTPASAYAVAFSAGAYVFYGGGSTLLQASASGITLGPTTSSYSIPTTINTYSGTILQLQKNNSTVASFDTTGSGSLSGNLSVTGSITAGSITNSGQNSAQSHQATGNGTVGAPSYSFTAQTDTGMYLPTQSTTAALLGLAVNGTQALALSKSGASVPGTLAVSGTTTLAATSTGALTPTTITASGAATATALTISASGGKLTFGDGTVQTTAYTGASGTSSSSNSTGSSYAESYVGPWGVNKALTANSAQYAYCTTQALAQYIYAPRNAVQLVGVSYFAYGSAATNVTINVSYYGSTVSGSATSLTTFSAQAVSTAGNSVYQTLSTPITLTAGNCYFINVTSSGSTTVNLEGYLVINTPLTLASASQAPSFSAGNGTDAAPAYTFANQTDTGLALPTASTTAAQMDLAVNGAQVLALKKTGVTAPVPITSSTAAGTPSFVSTQGFKSSIDMGTFWSNGTMPTSNTQLVKPVYSSSGGAQMMAAAWLAPFSGSVVGLSGYANGSFASGTTVTLTVRIGGTLQNLTTTLDSSGNGNFTTAAKGTYSFSAGNGLAVFISGSSSTINQSFSASIVVEMGA